MRREFARQAEAYARSPAVSRPELVEWLLRLTGVEAGASVLDVACGPGHVILALARHGCRATGVDLTPETLRVARRRAVELGHGARLACGHVTALPFLDRTFDLCVCRSAFHHFEDPAAALREMSRVTRRGGRVATLDHTTSERGAEAAWHDRVERLRDPSHAACLSPGRWHRLYSGAGLTPDREEAAAYPFDFGEWYERAFQGPEIRGEVESLLLAHPHGGVPGLRLLSRDPLTLQFDFLALSAPID